MAVSSCETPLPKLEPESRSRKRGGRAAAEDEVVSDHVASPKRVSRLCAGFLDYRADRWRASRRGGRVRLFWAHAHEGRDLIEPHVFEESVNECLGVSVMDAVSGAAVARQPSIDGKAVSTVNVNVTFVGSSLLGDRLTVTARRKGKGKRLLTCDVEAMNQDGEIVAIGVVTLRVRSGDGKFERRTAR